MLCPRRLPRDRLYRSRGSYRSVYAAFTIAVGFTNRLANRFTLSDTCPYALADAFAGRPKFSPLGVDHRL